MSQLSTSSGNDDKNPGSAGSWIVQGVHFPEGTGFRAEYKGKQYVGQVQSGALLVAGKRFKSPSAAAVEVTGRSANGWLFWECKFPGSDTWTRLKALRN